MATEDIHTYRITMRWHSRAADADAATCYVVETQEGRPGSIEYGPFPRELLDDFIRERKAYFQHLYNQSMAKLFKSRII